MMTTLDTIGTADTRELTIARGVREYLDTIPAWWTTAPTSTRADADATTRKVTA